MPMGRSLVSQPWQYGQCRTSRPQRSRTPSTSGSSSLRPVVRTTRRARSAWPPSVRTTKPGTRSSPVRSTATAVPSTTRAPYRPASSRPRASSSAGATPSQPR